MQPNQDPQWAYSPKGSAGDTEAKAGSASQDAPTRASSEEVVSWTASEYLAHVRGSGWYMGLVAIAVLATGILYFVTKSIFSAAIAPVLAIIIGIFVGHQPSIIKYELSKEGLVIGSKFYDYREFKAFSVIDEGGLQSILFSPAKRFMPPISAYFAPEDSDRITDMVGNYLPYETRQLDATERVARRLRF